MARMPEPEPDDADAGLEGNLGQATDAEWLAAHRALIDSAALPASELAYLYDPDRDPADVTPDELTVDRDPKEPGRG
jgi:hypothetical protein